MLSLSLYFSARNSSTRLQHQSKAKHYYLPKHPFERKAPLSSSSDTVLHQHPHPLLNSTMPLESNQLPIATKQAAPPFQTQESLPKTSYNPRSTTPTSTTPDEPKEPQLSFHNETLRIEIPITSTKPGNNNFYIAVDDPLFQTRSSVATTSLSTPTALVGTLVVFIMMMLLNHFVSFLASAIYVIPVLFNYWTL